MDLDAELLELARALPDPRAYTPMDRYRDFRAVFLGTDQGKRVLYDILRRANLMLPSALLAKFDPHKAFYLDGEKSLAAWINKTTREEPRNRATHATSTDEENLNG